MEPILNRVQLRRVRRQVKDINVVFLCQVNSLLLVMNCAIIHHNPALLLLLLSTSSLSHLHEQLPNEVQVLKLPVVALNEPPMRQPVIPNYGYQREALSFRDGTVDCDLFVWTRPCLVTSHVKIETWLVQKVDLSPPLQDLLIFLAVVIAFFEWFAGIFLFRDTLDPFLSEFSHFE